MGKLGKRFGVSAFLLAAFILWTAAVCSVDVQPIGPQGSCVGLAKINRYVHNLTGVHFPLYVITDWLGLIPIGMCMGFGALGLWQWIQRKKMSKVDRSLLVLGAFYIAVMAAYILFEMYAVNYRPVLIDGRLEVSYPSSTTMLVLCVMPTVVMQMNVRIKNSMIRRCIVWIVDIFTFFMVAGRLVSGVHWFTDIVGGVLLSAGLVMLYASYSGIE